MKFSQMKINENYMIPVDMAMKQMIMINMKVVRMILKMKDIIHLQEDSVKREIAIMNMKKYSKNSMRSLSRK